MAGARRIKLLKLSVIRPSTLHTVLRQCAVLLMVGAVAFSCYGQTQRPAKNPAPSAQSGVQSFTCPDPKAKQACDSYSELLKAKEKDLQREGYVCFRPDVDEFFFIHFMQPYFSKSLGPDIKMPGVGYLETYENGVSNPSIIPSFTFVGSWTAIGKGAFVSNEINFQPESKDALGTVTVTDGQFSVADYRYKSRLDKDLSYSLTVQRSTGRFSETTNEVGKQMPIVETHGRCIWKVSAER